MDASDNSEADDIAAAITKILVAAFNQKEGRAPTNDEVQMLIEELTEERIESMLSGVDQQVVQDDEDNSGDEVDNDNDEAEDDKGGEEDKEKEVEAKAVEASTAHNTLVETESTDVDLKNNVAKRSIDDQSSSGSAAIDENGGLSSNKKFKSETTIIASSDL